MARTNLQEAKARLHAAYEGHGQVMLTAAEVQALVLFGMPGVTGKPIDPQHCVHVTLHHARIDGARTVCLDCQMPIIVAVAGAATGRSLQAQYRAMLAKLDKQEGV